MVNCCDTSYHEQPSRPFRRRRPDVFNVGKWSVFLNDTWTQIKSTVQKTKQFSNSVLGKVTIYAVAELAGSALGKNVGGNVVGQVVSRLGVHLVPYTLISAAFFGTGMAAIPKTSKVAKVFFAISATASLALLLTIPPHYYRDYSKSIGFAVGESIGNVAGTILGGFGALYFAKSPVVLWDKENPWGSYSVSMIRFHSAGAVFDSIIATPTIPYIGSILSIPRTIVRSLTQTMAFSSNTVLPLAKECLQKRHISNKILAPFLVQLINDRFSSPNAPPVSKNMAQKLFSTLTKLSTVLERVLQVGVEHGMEKLVCEKNVNFLVTAALRSLHRYTLILRDSKAIKFAQKNFKESFTGSEFARHYYKSQLIETISNAVKTHPSYSKQIVLKIMESFLKDNRLQELSGIIVSKIQELEIEVIGVLLLKENKASYLKQLVDIYLQYYFVFLIFNLEQFNKELTPADEQEVILDLNNAIISTYIAYASPYIVSSVINGLTEGALQTFFKMKNILNLILQPPEQRALVSLRESSNPSESYFNAVTFKDGIPVKAGFSHTPKPPAQCDVNPLVEADFKHSTEDKEWEHVCLTEFLPGSQPDSSAKVLNPNDLTFKDDYFYS